MFDLMDREGVLEFVRSRVNELNDNKVGKLRVIYGSYCSKEKLGGGEFEWDRGFKRYMVGDIYRGNRWDWIREEVRFKGLNVNDVYVFSGKYGMINWNMEIEWYDKYFGKDDIEVGKEWIKSWCKGMVDKIGKFKLVYWVDSTIYRQSRQYVDIMEVIKEFGCELEIVEIW